MVNATIRNMQFLNRFGEEIHSRDCFGFESVAEAKVALYSGAVVSDDDYFNQLLKKAKKIETKHKR